MKYTSHQIQHLLVQNHTYYDHRPVTPPKAFSFENFIAE